MRNSLSLFIIKVKMGGCDSHQVRVLSKPLSGTC
jgi:hypothetical protein